MNQEKNYFHLFWEFVVFFTWTFFVSIRMQKNFMNPIQKLCIEFFMMIRRVKMWKYFKNWFSREISASKTRGSVFTKTFVVFPAQTLILWNKNYLNLIIWLDTKFLYWILNAVYFYFDFKSLIDIIKFCNESSNES